MRNDIADRMIQTAIVQPAFDMDDYVSAIKDIEHYLHVQLRNTETAVLRLNKALFSLKQFSDAVDGDLEIEISKLAVSRCVDRIKELMRQENHMKKKLAAVRTYLELLGSDDACWEEVTVRMEDA